MDKLSEYIPIVIILISVVFSILGKKKKPGNVTQETTLPGETAGDWLDEKKLPQAEIGSNRKFGEERTKKQVFNKRESVKKNEPVPSFSLDPISLETEEEGMNPPFSFEEEDVRQAIIYAEIINRREY